MQLDQLMENKKLYNTQHKTQQTEEKYQSPRIVKAMRDLHK